MQHEDVPDRTASNRYATVSFPAGRSGKPRAFSLSRWGLVSGIASFVLVVVVLTIAVILYTPVAHRLPIADQELENRYAGQITGIQKQLRDLAEEMNTLSVYNLRLRQALGEKISPDDSVLAASTADSSLPDSPAGEPAPGITEAGEKRVVVEPGEHALAAALRPELPGRAEPPARMSPAMPLTMPAEGYLSRGFDSSESHYGIDIAGKDGSGILAAASGRVVFSGWTYDDGFTLMIAHAEGFVTVYKHNRSLLRNTGAAVKRGELVALMGSTGRTSSGPHLHFEVWKNGMTDNPQQYLLTTP